MACPGRVDAEQQHGTGIGEAWASPRRTVGAERQETSPIWGYLGTARSANRGQRFWSGNISCFHFPPSSHGVPGATSNGPVSGITLTPSG